MKRHLWHGNVSRALILVEDFTDGFDLIANPPPEVRKLHRYLLEFSRYIDNNADLIPNYAERHRYGEVVSMAFVDSTVNQVFAKRFRQETADAMDAAWRSSAHAIAKPRARRHSRQRFQALAHGTAVFTERGENGGVTPPSFFMLPRVEPEFEQEGRRGDIGVGRPSLWCARAQRDEAMRAQIADQIAANLLAEEG